MPKLSVKKNKILHSKIFFVISFIILILISISVIKELIRRTETKKEVSSLENEINILQNQNEEMANLIDYFNSSSFQEKEVKKVLNMKESGEQVVYLTNKDINNIKNLNLSENNSNKIISSDSNPKKWWDHFFN